MMVCGEVYDIKESEKGGHPHIEILTNDLVHAATTIVGR